MELFYSFWLLFSIWWLLIWVPLTISQHCRSALRDRSYIVSRYDIVTALAALNALINYGVIPT